MGSNAEIASHSSSSTGGPRRPSEIRRVAIASFVGALLEWYDFFLFGTAAALVFGPLFFPSENPTVGTLAAFAAFGVGFVARPLGGIIFGHYGDKFGRKTVLVITLMIMGVCTVLIGLLPSYETIGVAAPVLLVVLRLLQGIGIGGEYAGAALMTIEHAPEHQKGFWGSLPQAAASGGILMATGAFALVSLLPEEQFLSWGWRLPFLFSALLLVVGLVIRLTVSESPEFEKAVAAREQVKEEAKKESIPLVEVITKHPRNLLLALGARLGETVTSNTINAFGIYYVTTQIGLDRSIALDGMLIASALGLVAVPLLGWFSDKIGRRPIYITGALLGVVLAYPMFWLFGTGNPALVILGFAVVYVLVPTTMFSVQSVFFSELFGTKARFTGLSLAYQVSAIAGGYVPTVATFLLLANGGSPALVALVFAGVCVITAVCAWLASDVKSTNDTP